MAILTMEQAELERRALRAEVGGLHQPTPSPTPSPTPTPWTGYAYAFAYAYAYAFARRTLSKPPTMSLFR